MVQHIILCTILITLLLSAASVSGAEDNEFNKSSVSILAEETLRRMLHLEDDDDYESSSSSEDEDSAESSSTSKSSNNSSPNEATPAAGDSTTTTTTSEELTTDQKQDKNLEYDGKDLIDWINSNGGLVHPNVRIGLDPSGLYRGVFVKTLEEGGTAEGIEEGDVIGRIPWDLIVKPDNYSFNVFWSCEALHKLHDEFKLGDESKYAPYINYLKNQPKGRLPAEWSDAGKKFLEEVIQGHNRWGGSEDGDWKQIKEGKIEPKTGLPPLYNLKDFMETYVGECGGDDTELARQAFYQFTSRDEDTLMVPFYDMHNHSNNPKLLNTISEKPERKGDSFILRAIQDIGPGEQIFISYNRCHKCWFDETYHDCDSYSHYGTSEVFNIFGFVEDYPQYWKYDMNLGTKKHPNYDTVTFCLERPDDDGPVVLTFGDNYTPNPDDEFPLHGNIEYMGKELTRLVNAEKKMKNDKELMESMPKYEWDMAWRYHEALMTSISAAVVSYDTSYEREEDGYNDNHGSEDGSEDDSEDGSSDDSSEDGSEDEEPSWVPKSRERLDVMKEVMGRAKDKKDLRKIQKGQDRKKDWMDEL